VFGVGVPELGDAGELSLRPHADTSMTKRPRGYTLRVARVSGEEFLRIGPIVALGGSQRFDSHAQRAPRPQPKRLALGPPRAASYRRAHQIAQPTIRPSAISMVRVSSMVLFLSSLTEMAYPEKIEVTSSNSTPGFSYPNTPIW
jgi:hypothetical protein